MLVVSAKSNLGCEAGCGVTVSFSGHARIMVGSCSDRSRIVNKTFNNVFQLFWRNFCEMLERHFSWQVQYTVMLEDDSSCSAHCKYRFICDADQS